MSEPKLEIRKYKSIKGYDEGDPFNCELWVDGKHVANVSYDGHGGGYNYTHASGPKKGIWWGDCPEHDHLMAWIKTLPKIDSFGMKIEPDLDILVDDEIQKLEVRKLCAKRTVFQKPGEEGWFSVKEPFSPKSRAWVCARYGDSVVFANETIAGQKIDANIVRARSVR
jgi:hypothetical protein